MATAQRNLTFLLAGPERRLLTWIAARLPRWVTSDLLTGIGVVGSIGAGVAYFLSGYNPLWLFTASGMLLVNWFGDSLDGTLARVRFTERPKYGYYLDHIVDAFSTAAIGVGLGLSPFMALELGLVVVVLYLTLSINVYLETHVYGVFKLGYGRLGPTEVRLILVAVNTALAAALLQGLPVWLVAVATNLVVAALAVGMFAILAVRFAKNLNRLAEMEPAKRWQPSPTREARVA